MTQTLETLTTELENTQYDLNRAQLSLDGKILEHAKFERMIKRIDDKQQLLDLCRDNLTEIATRVNPNSRKETVMKPATKSCSLETLQDALIDQKSSALDALYERIESLTLHIEDLQAAIKNVDRIALFARVLGETSNVFDMISATVNGLVRIGRSHIATELTAKMLRETFRNDLAVQNALEAYVRTIADYDVEEEAKWKKPAAPIAEQAPTVTPEPEIAPEPEPVAVTPGKSSKK